MEGTKGDDDDVVAADDEEGAESDLLARSLQKHGWEEKKKENY